MGIGWKGKVQYTNRLLAWSFSELFINESYLKLKYTKHMFNDFSLYKFISILLWKETLPIMLI